MNPPIFVSLDQIVASLRNLRTPAVVDRPQSNSDAGTAFATGFHVYSDIRVALTLSAAEDDRSAQLYLDILSTYAEIAEVAASIGSARLLEIQGERIHFLIEATPNTPQPDASLMGRLYALSQALVTLAYERLEPMAPRSWKGCAIAADFGPAAMLASTCGGGSLISLGNAANRPAKRLNSATIPAGFLAVPIEFTPPAIRKGPIGGWTEINLRAQSIWPKEAQSPDITPAIRNRLAENAQGIPAKLKLGVMDQHFFEALRAKRQIAPVRVQGICFRADLDGFTKEVQAAFSRGPEAVFALVGKFRAVLEFPSLFAQGLNADAILLPWAGDCATMILMGRTGETFKQARTYLPVQAALAWHKRFGEDRKFVDSVGKANWALGMAAGDMSEGRDGQMIVGDISAGGRLFRIASGWAVRQSNEGCQFDGVVGGDTVITQVDRDNLVQVQADAFQDLGADFAKAGIDRLRQCVISQVKRAAVAQTQQVASGLTTPAPRPYYNVQRD